METLTADVNARSAVHRVPADIVIEILGWLSYASRVRSSQAFALWRSIALAEPTLWNVINIERTQPMRRLYELAARARDAPLYVSVARQAAESAVVQKFLIAHAARLVTFHCSLVVLAYGGGVEEVQPAPEMPLRVRIPRCEQLMNLAIVGRGAQLRVDLDNARLPVLRTLNLSSVTNLDQILPTLRTPVELTISLDRLADTPQLSLSALHILATNCSELRELTVDDLSDRAMTFDDPPTSGTPIVLKTVVLGLNETSREKTARLLRCFTAETVVAKRLSLRITPGLMSAANMHMYGMPIEDDFGAMFQQLEGPIGVTVAPSTIAVNIHPPRPHRNGAVLLVATDGRQFRRELSGIADLRHVVVMSGLASRIQRMDCSARVWFNRLGVLDRNPAVFTHLPQAQAPVFPELVELILLYDDEPNVKRHVSMPVCGALRSVQIWEMRALPEPRTLDVEAVDQFITSVVGTESVHLDSVMFVGPVSGADSDDTVAYRCATHVVFKTVPRAFDSRKFQSQGQMMSYGTMEPFDDDDWF